MRARDFDGLIIGKVLHLTKQICLKEPEDGSGRVERFMAAKRGINPFLDSSSFGMEWWLTSAVFEIRRDIAEKAISFDPQLEGSDTESFSRVITETLQECAGNTTFFTFESLILSGASTLFEARVIEAPREFGTRLWNEIRTNLVNSLAQWITMYPLQLVKADSFTLGFDGLTLLSSADDEQWAEISKDYIESKLWNPSTGCWDQKVDRQTMKEFCLVPSWLVCEVSGTVSGSREFAGDNMRTFIAVLCSYLNENTLDPLMKSGAIPATYSIQFPSDIDKVGCSSTVAPIGNLFPPLLLNSSALDVSSDILSKVQNWYKQRAGALDSAKQKVTTAAHFIHYGIIYDGLERFIHFFIALDALFGESGNVGKNFKEGIKKTFPGQDEWVDRADKLYNLRNGLIHGEISSIRKWEKLDKYRRHYKSHPLKDIQTAAMTALRVYFTNQVFEHLFIEKSHSSKKCCECINNKKD